MKNIQLINVYDSNGNFVKQVYKRYAFQRVQQGAARWIKNQTAIRLRTPYAIFQVFPNIGDRKSIALTMKALIIMFYNEKYPKKKASGSIGGGSKNGFIRLVTNSIGIKEWVRVR